MSDGHGSLTHLFAYMDDISSSVAHEDIEFFYTEIDKLEVSKGCFVNPLKTRILTSCTGESILQYLNPKLATSITSTINRYSIKENKDRTTSPVELTTRF
jgi:hypothetical protein